MIKSIFNILAICGAAGFAGVMLCIGVTLGGYWSSLSKEEFLEWFVTNNQFVANSIPIIFMLSLVGLIGSIWFSWGSPDLKYWLFSLGCIVFVAVLTFAFFVPTNTAFASGTMNQELATAKLAQWLKLHYFRIGFGMAAAVFGCLAIKS